MSYITEKRLTKHPEQFGKAIEGVAGPEAANNASAAGTVVPLLSLGLPTNATAAIMLAAFTGFGIQPGPLLLQREGDLVWALIASLFIGNLFLLLLNLPLAPVWAKLLRTPRPYLYAGILFFASMGAYAVNGSNFDLILLLLLGLLGFVMRRFGLPVLPLIVAVILGPRVELQGRRALQLSSGDVRGLFGSTNVTTGQFELSPIAITVYVIIALIVAWPLVFKLVKRLLPAKAAAAVEAVSEEPALQIAEHHHVDSTDAPVRTRLRRRPDPRKPRTRRTSGDHRGRIHPTAPGRAALETATSEATKSNRPLVVVNTSRGDALDDPNFAQQADLEWVRATLEESGVAFTVRQEVRGREAADELLDVLEEIDADLCVIGIRKRTAVGKMLLGSNASGSSWTRRAQC